MHLAIVILFKFLSIKIPLHINRDWGGQDCLVDVVLALHINNIKLRTTLSLSLFSICRQRKWRRNWTSRLLHPPLLSRQMFPLSCLVPSSSSSSSSSSLFRNPLQDSLLESKPGLDLMHATEHTMANTLAQRLGSTLNPYTRPSWTAPRTMGWTSHQGACRRVFPTMV